MIGIIAAMPIEMERLRALIINPVVETFGGIEFVRGTLENHEIVTAVCGIGKVFAAMCAQTMILRYEPEAVICTGVAGTLTPELSIGSIAVSSDVVQHDMDISALGDPIGWISGLNLVKIPADARLAAHLTDCAQALGIRTKLGTIASGDQFISSIAQKERILSAFGAIACEMEGAAIGQACSFNHVPFCVLRAISDSADGSSHMDYPQFTSLAAAQSVRLLCAFLRN